MVAQGETDRVQTQGIIIPLLTFGAIGIGAFISFCIARRISPDIYSPRRILKRGKPPKITRGFLTWIPTVYNTQESFLISTVGVDGVMLLRFFKFGYRLFGILTVLCLTVLAPVNYFSNPPDLSNAQGLYLESALLKAISVLNVPNQSPYLKVHLAFTWIISFVTIAFILTFYRNFVALKLKYEEYCLSRTEMSKIEMRSIMVFGVPHDLRNDVDLAAYFANLGIGKVENVVLCRNWSKLQKAVAERAFYLQKLEKCYVQCQNAGFRLSSVFRRGRSSYIRGAYLLAEHSRSPTEASPFLPRRSLYEGEDAIIQEVLARLDLIDPAKRPTHRTGFLGILGPKVDSALYYAAEFRKWDREVTQLRRAPENSVSTSVAIVTFESPESATLASQAVLHRRPFTLMTKLAPEPRDIFWPNLSSRAAQNYTKLARSIFVLGSMFILIFFSTFIVSSIAALIDLEKLAVMIPMLGSILKDLPNGWIQIIQGVIPVVLLSGWTSCLPSVLLVLCRAQGLEAISWIETSLLSKYFFYQLWNVLFVTVFARTLIYDILQNPASLIETLGQMLPKSSTTITTYVILQGAAVFPAQLLLAGPLILTWISRASSLTKSTPREISDAYYPTILTCINYGVIYPVPLLVFVIGLIYAPINPIILPFCTLFFAIGYFVYKYILMYVHVPKYESRGSAISIVLHRCLAGLAIMQLTMMGFLALKAGDSKKVVVGSTAWSGYAQMVIGVMPLILITYFINSLLKQGYQQQLDNIPLDIIANVSKDLSRKTHQDKSNISLPLSGHFGQELSDLSINHDQNLNRRISVVSMLGRQRYSDPISEFHFQSRSKSESPAQSSIVSTLHSKPSILFPDGEPPAPFEDEPLPEPIERDFLLNENGSISEYEDLHSLENHLEPPMTRVAGILDAPLEAALLRYGDQDLRAFLTSTRPTQDDDPMNDDLQIHTYLHPALIGKLPIAWLPGLHDPPRLAELREDQGRRQRELWRRVVTRQQIGVDSNDNFEYEQDHFTRFGSFVDGLTSWMHLNLS